MSNVAMMQASTLQTRQRSNDIEVEALRRQILDYQVNTLVDFYCHFDKNLPNQKLAHVFH